MGPTPLTPNTMEEIHSKPTQVPRPGLELTGRPVFLYSPVVLGFHVNHSVRSVDVYIVARSIDRVYRPRTQT